MNNLSIVIPVHNEKRYINTLIPSLIHAVDKLHIQYEMIIIEDGSTDDTPVILTRLQKKYSFNLHSSSARKGYTDAILYGIPYTSGEFILHIDSDGQYDPADIRKLWIRRSTADAIVGIRIKRMDSPMRIRFSAIFRIFFDLLFPNSLTDPSSPFVMYRRSKLFPLTQKLSHMDEGFWWGFSALCLVNRLKIVEIPIAHKRRASGKSTIYTSHRLPGIAIRNLYGLLRLKFAV